MRQFTGRTGFASVVTRAILYWMLYFRAGRRIILRYAVKTRRQPADHESTWLIASNGENTSLP